MIDFEIARKLLDNYQQLRVGTEELVLESVQGSTIRAYREASKFEPLSIFRKWGFDFLNEQLDDFKSCNDYEVLHRRMVNSLLLFWKNREETSLPEYKAYKLVDLMGKKLPHWIELSESQRIYFLQRVHVPVDKYSLIFLREESEAYRMKIKAGTESMGWLNGEQISEYPKIQKEIERICGELPPIAFDLLSWNASRNFELKEKKKK